MNRRGLAIVASGLAGLIGFGCDREPKKTGIVFTAEEIREILKLSPLPRIPPNPTNAVADNPAAARLGQRLFFDAQLSANGAVACATCHNPAHGFSDPKTLSAGLGTTERHSMALWNVAHQRWFYWSGRKDSLWAQAIQPLLHSAEMGSSPERLFAVLSGDAGMKYEYEAIFGPLPASANADTPSADRLLSHFGKVIEAYERRIVSTDAPFDRFVEMLRSGKVRTAPISESAQRGLQLFVGRGRCVLCHAGPNFSDGEFHNLGLPGALVDQGRFAGIMDVREDRFNGLGAFSDDRSPETNIKLRYLTVKPNHLGEFKTPTLRNVAQTAPYMHHGHFATLREVLDFYSELPGETVFGHREETLQPRHFTEGEKADLEAFLHTLTGAPLDDSLTRPPAAGG
ncbi:MAG: cytochrome c peroxidase [Chthoniobacteraceae bacterium]